MIVNNLYWMANFLGVLSLLGCVMVFFPVIAKMFIHSLNKRILFKVSRWGLIIAAFSGLSHGLIMTQEDNINFYDLKTYWTYAEGLLTFNLLMFFAISFSEIKLDRQKFLYFVYALLFLVGNHLSETVLTY